MESTRLIAAAVAGIALLLFLVIRSKLQAFVALLLVSLLIGVAAGMPLDGVLASVTSGMGGTLGAIAILVGLGAMFGQMLEVSGGAEALSRAMLNRLGEKRAQWALGITGFLVAIPVFFDVGVVILVPAIYGLVKKTDKSLLYYAMPLLAGLAVTHVFIPPTPGPIAVAGILGADLGWVILFGVIAGIPALIIAGPLFGTFMAKRIEASVPEYMVAQTTPKSTDTLPPVGTIAALIGAPLLFILAGSLAKVLLPEGTTREVLQFAGHPTVALTATTLLSFHLLGKRRGMDSETIRDVATKALEPAGIIILVTGAGGVLKQVLIDSGVGNVMADAVQSASIPPILVAFVIAGLMRVMQGSATVAMLSAAGLVAALISDMNPSPPMLALIALGIASGATIASHVNDSGFWLVNRYLGLSVTDTLRTWTVATTLIGVVGLAVAMVLSIFF